MSFFLRSTRGSARLRRHFSVEEMLAAAAFSACALVFSAQALMASDFKAGPIEIDHPWSRATPNGAKVAGGFLVLKNTGATPDRLVSATAPFAGKVEIHEMAVNNGIMTMRPLDKGLEVPAGGTVALKPGSYHIMFTDLKQPLKEGELVDGTLTFEKAGTVKVQFKVEGIGAGAPAPAPAADPHASHTGH